MSVKMMFAAMEVETGSPITKLVLLKLADNANDSGECWPSYNTIARICEISLRSAKNHIEKLIDMGLVVREKRTSNKGNIANKYKINITVTPSANPAPPPSASDDNLVQEIHHPSAPDALPPSAPDAPESVSLLNQSIEPLSQESLSEFIEHRKRIKKPMTELAVKNFLKKLIRFKESGYDIELMVEDAIINGWQSVVDKPQYKRVHNHRNSLDEGLEV